MNLETINPIGATTLQIHMSRGDEHKTVTASVLESSQSGYLAIHESQDGSAGGYTYSLAHVPTGGRLAAGPLPFLRALMRLWDDPDGWRMPLTEEQLQAACAAAAEWLGHPFGRFQLAYPIVINGEPGLAAPEHMTLEHWQRLPEARELADREYEDFDE